MYHYHPQIFQSYRVHWMMGKEESTCCSETESFLTLISTQCVFSGILLKVGYDVFGWTPFFVLGNQSHASVTRLHS